MTQPIDPTIRFKNFMKLNWGRQNTQSLQAVLAVAPLKKGKAATGKREIFVCVCVCVCVHRTFLLHMQKVVQNLC